ncbi:MAG: phage terminase large subunit [Methyloprofundus sp.]|nr:phage terminase large subunit [Methyloprofundus sp.]
MQDFISYINKEYIVSDFSRQVCTAIDEFLNDMQQGMRPVLILGAPPQHGKSDIVSRYLPAFIFGLNPNIRVAGISYGKDLASDMNRDVQRIMLSPEYKIIFPQSSLAKSKASDSSRRNNSTFEVTGFRGSYTAQGVGGALTGKKVDLGIIDDAIKNASEALSTTVKEGVWSWYTSTFLTRLSKNSGQIIMATRWAVDDLSGKVTEKTPGAKVLSFKAISDEGKALIPELHPIEKLLETKAVLSDYFWSAMYQQSPVVLGGGLFKTEWWRFYSTLPKISYRVIYADTAQKTKEHNDYSVLQCWGVGHYDKKIYLLDMIRGKWEAPQLLTQAKAFYDKHKAAQGVGTLRQIKIEDKSSGTGLIQQLKQMGVPVVGIPRSTDKVSRALDVAPQIEVGNVYLPEGTAWLSDYLSEFAAFPNAAHDDTVDPTIDAINDMLIGNKILDYGRLL